MNTNSLQNKLMCLDAALTGKDADTVANMARQQNMTHETLWMGGLYYLSDGGYSRLRYDEFEKRLFICSESRLPVKANWKQCEELMRAIEKEIEEFINTSTDEDEQYLE